MRKIYYLSMLTILAITHVYLLDQDKRNRLKNVVLARLKNVT